VKASGRRLDVHQHVVDSGACRPLPERTLESRHGVGVSLRDHLDAAIVQVLDRTRQALTMGGRAHVKPEPDALDPASHEKASSDAHELSIIAGALRGWRPFSAADEQGTML
jgi:hypothetical protein